MNFCLNFSQGISCSEKLARLVYNFVYQSSLCCLKWSLKAFLDLKDLSQRLQGMIIPSKWFASMWSFMWLPMSSFPHTLHRVADWRPLANLFSLFSIIDFTLFSNSAKSPEKSPGMANVLFSPRFCRLILDDTCPLKAISGTFVSLLLISGLDVWDIGFSSSTKLLTRSSCFPIKPFSWSSSAMARNESRFSW